MPYQVQEDGYATEVEAAVVDTTPVVEAEPPGEPTGEPGDDRCACGRPWDACASGGHNLARDWV